MICELHIRLTRKDKFTKHAVHRAKTYIDDEYRWGVDTDLERFFDRVNLDILMYKLLKPIEDKRVLKLIREYLQSGILINV